MKTIDFKEDNLDYYDWAGVYTRVAYLYYNNIKRYRGLKNANTEYIRKNLLQGKTESGLKEDCKKYRDKLFNWLDQTKSPFTYIFYPQYNYTTIKNVYGRYKEEYSGINKITLSIAKDYAMYKMGYQTVKGKDEEQYRFSHIISIN